MTTGEAPTLPRRRRGTGTIERMRDGTYRARMPGARGRLPPCGSYEDAARCLEAALDDVRHRAVEGPAVNSLATFGADFLDAREHTHADAHNSRLLWHQHIASAPFATGPIRAITPDDIREWRDAMLKKRVVAGNKHCKVHRPRKLSRSRVQNALNLLRVALYAAVERKLLPSNPAMGIRLPRDLAATHDPWTYLMPEEQSALLGAAATPLPLRCLIAFALGTGMRESEVYSLHLADLRGVSAAGGVVTFAPDAVVVVRYGGQARGGGKGRATKGRRIRYVPIFGYAREALETWLPMLEGHPNPSGLVWPLRGGERRQDAKAPRGWGEALVAAGIVTKHDRGKGRAPEYRADHRHDGMVPTFHALRHTCASSLVAGWWGRRWSLEEVKALLGHRQISTTERYAHLADSALTSAARATEAAADLSTICPRDGGATAVSTRNHSAPPARLERTTFGLGNPSAMATTDGGMAAICPPVDDLWTDAGADASTLAIKALMAIASGKLGGATADVLRAVAQATAPSPAPASPRRRTLRAPSHKREKAAPPTPRTPPPRKGEARGGRCGRGMKRSDQRGAP